MPPILGQSDARYKFIGSLAFKFWMWWPPKDWYPRSDFRISQILVKSIKEIWRSSARNDPPNFNRVSDWPKIGGKTTKMDIDVFTDTSVQASWCVNLLYRDNDGRGGGTPPPLPTFLGLILVFWGGFWQIIIMQGVKNFLSTNEKVFINIKISSNI